MSKFIHLTEKSNNHTCAVLPELILAMVEEDKQTVIHYNLGGSVNTFIVLETLTCIINSIEDLNLQ